MRVLSTLLVLSSLVLAGCVGPLQAADADGPAAREDAHYVPHVIVAVADTGINPYHDLFSRPELTQHPCTYIRDFPCDVQELRLSLDIEDWNEAFEADRATWESLERGTWYWIPQTVFVAVRCDEMKLADGGFPVPRTDVCVLDDRAADESPGHGTGTTSVVTLEAPDALIAFNENIFQGIAPFFDGGIPVDVFSFSQGSWTPYPMPTRVSDDCPTRELAPILVRSAGNWPWPLLLDCGMGHADAISVGGADGATRSHFVLSGVGADITSHYCPPAVPLDHTSRVRAPGELCGTSFSAPAAAGGIARVVLELRRASGYDGTITTDGLVDPILGISVRDLRDAVNLTATYEPTPRYPSATTLIAATRAPLAPAAPWMQWGWGFFDGDVANATIAHLLGTQPAPAKPAAATQYMTTSADVRRTIYG